MAQLRKILLVDDDDDLREALSEQLVMTEDFDVFEAGSGSEAMEKAYIYDGRRRILIDRVVFFALVCCSAGCWCSAAERSG